MLVTLLTKATTLQPDLPVFDPTFQPKTNTQSTIVKRPATNSHAHPPTQQIPNSTPSATIPAPPDFSATIIRDMEDSEDGYGSDEHPSHYPRPGQGFMATLPPDKEDEHYLVDEDNSRQVFTHIYQVDPKAANAGLSVAAAP